MLTQLGRGSPWMEPPRSIDPTIFFGAPRMAIFFNQLIPCSNGLFDVRSSFPGPSLHSTPSPHPVAAAATWQQQRPWPPHERPFFRWRRYACSRPRLPRSPRTSVCPRRLHIYDAANSNPWAVKAPSSFFSQKRF